MKALLVIDVQNDYFPGGKSELVGSLKALEAIKSAIHFFRKKQLPVIFIQHVNTSSGAAFFIPDTFGVEIHQDIAPLENEPVIVKHAPNSFFETSLLDFLRSEGINELVVCGMMTHMCIDTTVRAARDHKIPVTLLYDACATKDLEMMGNALPAAIVHDAYMAGLNGMFAEVKLTEQLRQG